MFGIEVERLGDALRDDNTPENERIVLLNPVSYTWVLVMFIGMRLT